MKPQVLPVEQIEHKLQEIASKGAVVLVRVILFGGVEMCHLGNLSMDFDTDEAGEPFFTVSHVNQYATTIRFYGTDVMRLTNEKGTVEIYLGVKA